MDWILREVNDKADNLIVSRIVDFDDWGIVKTDLEDLSGEWVRMKLIYLLVITIQK